MTDPRGYRAGLLCTALLALLVLSGGASCSDAQLYNAQGTGFRNDRVTLSGNFCTIDPAQEQFPVKIMFLIDTSTTMQALDPTYSVAQAVSDVFDRYLHTTQGNYSFGVIGYGGKATLLSGGPTDPAFTRQPNLLQNALQLLRLPSPCLQQNCRDLLGAVSLAASLISGDVQTVPKGLAARTRYAIINLLGDPPSPRVMLCQCSPQADPMCSMPDTNCEQTIYTRTLQKLLTQVHASGAQELRYHTLYLRDVTAPMAPATPIPATAHNDAINLLQRLSATGGGQFLCDSAAPTPNCSLLYPPAGSPNAVACAQQNLLCPPSAVSFLDFGLASALKPFLVKKLVVYNLNTIGTQSGPVLDSDGDGLSDEDEMDIGTQPDNADTDGDGLTDFVELRLGKDPLVKDPQPGVCLDIDFSQLGLYPLPDSDGDLLNDCEERLLGLDQTLADSDGDGLPDGLELRSGTNALAADYLLPLYDHDGIPNGDELRQHTAPRADDTMDARGYAYFYSETDEGVMSLPYSSQPQTVTGVTVLSVTAGSTAGAGTLKYTIGPPNCDAIYPQRSSDADQKAYQRCQACPTCPTLQWKDASPYECDFGPPVLIDKPLVQMNAGATLTLPSLSVSGGCSKSGGVKQDWSLVVRVENAAVLPQASVTETIVIGTAQRDCEQYQVSNIALKTPLPNRTLGAQEPRNGVNNIYVLFGQGPDGQLSAPGVFSTALVQVRYVPPAVRSPATPNLVLQQGDFVVLGGN